jgi:hypothetical protein
MPLEIITFPLSLPLDLTLEYSCLRSKDSVRDNIISGALKLRSSPVSQELWEARWSISFKNMNDLTLECFDRSEERPVTWNDVLTLSFLPEAAWGGVVIPTEMVRASSQFRDVISKWKQLVMDDWFSRPASLSTTVDESLLNRMDESLGELSGETHNSQEEPDGSSYKEMSITCSLSIPHRWKFSADVSAVNRTSGPGKVHLIVSFTAQPVDEGMVGSILIRARKRFACENQSELLKSINFCLDLDRFWLEYAELPTSFSERYADYKNIITQTPQWGQLRDWWRDKAFSHLSKDRIVMLDRSVDESFKS